jgi:uncharacterized protein (TIGR02231 family)
MAPDEKIETRTRFFPELDPERAELSAPIREVTLLEDRARVRRSGKVTLKAGHNRLLVRDVAPVLQDVSLRGEVEGTGSARMTDLRVRRAVRVRSTDKPEQARDLEQRIEKLTERFAEVTEDRGRGEQRYGVLLDILSKAMSEIPEDAGWGMVNQQLWHDTLEAMFKRARGLVEGVVEQYGTQLDLCDEAERLAAQRRAFDRWDSELVAWIELDVDAPAAGEVVLRVEYVVPCALWRPLHSARLTASGKLSFRSAAAVWQNTGEDWNDVQLLFSTARSSLGTEPPLLSDDLLAAQRKAERIVVEQREVAVQRAGLGRDAGGGPVSTALELPGVDDGGDIQTLTGRGPSRIASDGRLSMVPIFEFEAPADCRLVAMPELEQKAFLKAVVSNTSPHPILAGPVELLRESGVVGWTRVLFVAPRERFELSFGHDDGVRVYRATKTESKHDEVDHWTHTQTLVHVYVSNLEDQEKQLEVTERIPVSEIEHVRVKLVDEQCKPMPKLDKDGFCSWQVTLPPNAQTSLKLGCRVSTAPGVEGL